MLDKPVSDEVRVDAGLFQGRRIVGRDVGFEDEVDEAGDFEDTGEIVVRRSGRVC
jgi:hypothetical protein